MSQRRDQILAAALRCFVREGLHRTSMSDVVAESGMSAGSVYRYFPSKHALITACAHEVFTTLQSTLVQLADSPEPPTPPDAVDAMLGALERASARRGVDLARLAISLWAEALRDAELADLAREFYTSIIAAVGTALQHWAEKRAGTAAPTMEMVGSMHVALVQGYMIQHSILGDAAPRHRDYVEALRVLDRQGV
jgi:AcrR family transcriptional regulator